MDAEIAFHIGLRKIHSTLEIEGEREGTNNFKPRKDYADTIEDLGIVAVQYLNAHPCTLLAVGVCIQGGAKEGVITEFVDPNWIGRNLKFDLENELEMIAKRRVNVIVEPQSAQIEAAGEWAIREVPFTYVSLDEKIEVIEVLTSRHEAWFRATALDLEYVNTLLGTPSLLLRFGVDTIDKIEEEKWPIVLKEIATLLHHLSLSGQMQPVVVGGSLVSQLPLRGEALFTGLRRYANEFDTNARFNLEAARPSVELSLRGMAYLARTSY